MGGVGHSDHRKEAIPLTTHHPLSTAAKTLARCMREHEQQPSTETAAAMVAALRTLKSEVETVENTVLADASHQLSTREIARTLGYSSHTPIRRKLKQQEDPAMSKKDANAEYRAAKDELERISKRDRSETDAYLAANKRVIEAEKNVSRWRR